MVIWIIGLSGAGKTTVGQELVRLWRQAEPATALVDGDAVRTLFAQSGDCADHSADGRRKNAQRMTALCEWLDQQGMNVVCCILSIFPEMRNANRDRFSAYGEVYLRTQLATLMQRDTKGLYAAALSGKQKNVVGVDIPFPEPDKPDMIFDTDFADQSPAHIARCILDWVEQQK